MKPQADKIAGGEAFAGVTVDLVIPALNEESNIPRLMDALPRPLLRHIIVADNGSTDRTAELARAGGAQVVCEKQRGYGAACQAALGWINRHAPDPLIVAFLDADLADDPSQLHRLLRPIMEGGADLVIGSRSRLTSPGAMTLTQRVGNAFACLLLRIATGARFSDLGPMRAIRTTSLRELSMTDRTWGWTIEMQYKAARKRLRFVEIDVPYRRRHSGSSKISGTLVGAARAGSRILLTIGQLWWRDRVRPKR